MLKAAVDAGSPAVNRLCSLAIIYGCMGKELKAQTMLAKSQAFYAEALHRARALIEQTDKTALAKLVPAVLMMAMYEVSTLFIRNKAYYFLTIISGQYKTVPGILTSMV